MKTTLTLNKQELSQAVADFVAKSYGKAVKVDVSFDVLPHYDYTDRPTGTYTITADAVVEDAKQ